MQEYSTIKFTKKIGTKNQNNNKNKNNNNTENGETLLTLNEKENDEHLEMNKKIKQMKNNLKNIKKQLKNKTEISTDLLNKLKLKSHEYFNEISEFTTIIQNNFTLLKDKNGDNKFDIVNEIEKYFENFVTITQSTNIFNQILSLIGDHFQETNEENKKLKITNEQNQNEIKRLQINSQSQKEKIVKLESEKDKLTNQLNQAQNNFQTKLNEYDEIINTKRNELIQKINTKKIAKIPLKFYSCKGYYNNDDKNHPNNLLKSDDSLYASLLNREFKRNENDWIIFSIDDNRCQSYFFKHFKIKNCEHTWMQGVKKIGIWIGNALSNEWFEYKPQPIDNIKNTTEKMQYEIFINDYSYMLNKNKKFKFLKIMLYDNHGNTDPPCCKFAFQEFQMFGVRV